MPAQGSLPQQGPEIQACLSCTQRWCSRPCRTLSVSPNCSLPAFPVLTSPSAHIPLSNHWSSAWATPGLRSPQTPADRGAPGSRQPCTFLVYYCGSCLTRPVTSVPCPGSTPTVLSSPDLPFVHESLCVCWVHCRPRETDGNQVMMNCRSRQPQRLARCFQPGV